MNFLKPRILTFSSPKASKQERKKEEQPLILYILAVLCGSYDREKPLIFAENYASRCNFFLTISTMGQFQNSRKIRSYSGNAILFVNEEKQKAGIRGIIILP